MGAELLRRADLVFTGGWSLYEAKKDLHHDVHAMPSSVDVAHFAQSRRELPDPPDQAGISRPRLGYFGVIDERMDLELLAAVADARADWQLVLAGPIVKIDRADVPARPNIHLLGPKPYAELPSYVAGWDVALLPFARNDATRYISPTKTPEYLAAGRPVVSTSIQDVVNPYGEAGLVRIADEPEAFVAAVAAAMQDAADPNWRAAVDVQLADMSWDKTFEHIEQLMRFAHANRQSRASDAALTA